MADDLTVQAQVQPQVKRKDNTLPYTIGGAAIGGAAGAAFPMIKTKYSSWEDVVKESEDTFNKQIDKGGDNKTYWETAKEQAQKINEAEKNYDAEVEKIKNENKTTKVTVTDLPDSEKALKDELTNAQKAYDDRLKSLVDAEKSRLNAGNSRVTEFPTRKLLSDELSAAEFNKFEPFLNNYEKARKVLLGQPGQKFQGGSAKSAYDKIKTEKQTVENMYNDIYNNNYKNLADKDKAKFDPTKGKVSKKIQSTVDNLLPEKFGTSIRPLANQNISYSCARYNYNQFKAFQDRFGAEMFEIVDKDPGNTPGKGKFKVKNGSKDAWVIIDNAAVKAKREAMKAEYAENIKRTMELKTQLGNFDTEFFKANEAALKDLKQPITSAANLSKLEKPSFYKQSLNDLDVKELALNNGTKKYPVTIGSDVIHNADELRVLRMQYQAEKELAEQYTKSKAQITNELKSIVRQDVRVDSAYRNMQNVIENDKGVKNAIDAVEKRLNGKYASEADKSLYEKVKGLMKPETSITPEEINTKAEEAAKKAIEGEKVATDLKTAQNKVAAKIKELGLEGKELSQDELNKIVEKKLGTKAEYTEKAKKTAQEAIEKNLEKYTKGSRGWTALAGAAVLALAGLGIAAATKKDA